MNDQTSLDPIEVAKVVAGTFLSPKLAAMIGPYAIILLMALAGSGLALANRKPTARTNAFLFVAWTTILSIMLTVPAATLVSAYIDGSSAQWFFSPMAFLLAYIGDRWKELLAAVIDAIKLVIRNWAMKGNPNE